MVKIYLFKSNVIEIKMLFWFLIGQNFLNSATNDVALGKTTGRKTVQR